MSQPFLQAWPNLLENGYTPIPLIEREKRPIVESWQDYGFVPPDEEQMWEWQNKYPKSNIGVVCGQIVALDIDTDDMDVIRAIENVLPEMRHCPRRVGKKGYVAVFRQNATQPVVTATWKWKAEGSDRPSTFCEVFGMGRQIAIPPSIHPDTGRQYIWMDDGLEDVSIDELPEAPSNLKARLDAALSPFVHTPDGRSGASYDRLAMANKPKAVRMSLEELNDALMEPRVIDVWMNELCRIFPDLDAKNTKPGWWSMFSIWRERADLDKRKRSTSIRPDGLRDHSADIGYRPVWFVLMLMQKFRSSEVWDEQIAANWFRRICAAVLPPEVMDWTAEEKESLEAIRAWLWEHGEHTTFLEDERDRLRDIQGLPPVEQFDVSVEPKEIETPEPEADEDARQNAKDFQSFIFGEDDELDDMAGAVLAESSPSLTDAEFDAFIDMGKVGLPIKSSTVFGDAFSTIYKNLLRNMPLASRETAFCGAIALSLGIAQNYYRGPYREECVNLYLHALAESGTGKSTMLNYINSVGAEVDMPGFGLDELASVAGLDLELQNNPTVVAVIDEIGEYYCSLRKGLGGTEPFKAAVIKHMTKLFSKSSVIYRTSSKASTGGSKEIPYPHMSVVGVSTPERYWQAFTAENIQDGGLARHMTMHVGQTAINKYDPSARDFLVRFLIDLKHKVQNACAGGFANVTTVKVQITMDASSFYTDMIEPYQRSLAATMESVGMSVYSPFAFRVSEKAMKLAMLFAIMDNPTHPLITSTQMESAFRVAIWNTSHMIYWNRELALSTFDTQHARDLEHAKVVLAKTVRSKTANPARFASELSKVWDERRVASIMSAMERIGIYKTGTNHMGNPALFPNDELMFTNVNGRSKKIQYGPSAGAKGRWNKRTLRPGKDRSPPNTPGESPWPSDETRPQDAQGAGH